ncbi:MAG: hypothetical protein KAH56_07575 [Candidatus Krumholzibacteria bacterium]|nr:hypothetical protein [Candidatus Krumholzibacteria bacterium]
MKKMVLVLTLAAFALSGSAFAQDPNWNDNIGMYLTPDGFNAPNGTGSCGAAAENEIFISYLVLSKLTNAEVWGWEAKVIPTNMLFMGDLVYGDHVDAGTRDHEYIVGLAGPLFAVDRAVVVAEIQYQVNSYYNDINQPSYVAIENIYFHLLPDAVPAYLEASGSTGVELHPAIYGPYQLIINGDCNVVATEEATWGGVKSLYR